MAAWEITGHKYGANALNIQRMLGLNSYKTAWAWLHKLRRAMVRPERDLLSGNVEIDETYVGAVIPGGGGRHTGNKAIVGIAIEVLDHGFGRIRVSRIADVSGKSLEAFAVTVIQPGACVMTDGWKGYNGLSGLGYDHLVTYQSASPDPEHVLMPGVHRVASLLKRWLLGTYQGAVSNEHLNYYLDEFVFRFNRRRSRSRGLLFYRLMEQPVRTSPIPTQTLFLGTGRGIR
jgi:transposase-like protein